jgi:3-oxoadipate enol-lactonase
MKTRIGSVDINYTVEGQGPWVVLSHSLACDQSMWEPQMPALTEHYSVLRFDTRGHGGSSSPLGPYTLDELADDVHGLLEFLGIERMHWIGLSLGGMIGQTYALKHPEKFASMVLADTTSRRPANAADMWGERIRTAQSQGMEALIESTLARWFTEPFRQKNPDVMLKIGAVIRSTPVNGFSGCCEAIAKIDVLDRLKEIDFPVLVMVGEHDHGTPPAMALQIHDNLLHSQYLLIPDAAHIANIEQSSVFNAAILDFLGRQKAPV